MFSHANKALEVRCVRACVRARVCLSHHGAAVGPAEVVVEHLIVEADPLVVLAQTCHAAKHNTLT